MNTNSQDNAYGTWGYMSTLQKQQQCLKRKNKANETSYYYIMRYQYNCNYTWQKNINKNNATTRFLLYQTYKPTIV